MDQEYITRELLSAIIDRYIHETAADPGRAVRKLLDMAERTSDGPTQRICYQMMQQMAADQASPYYEMIHHLVMHTSPETVKQFGINLGHNAWTFGSGHVRQLTEDRGIPISWAVMVDRSAASGRIPFSSVADLISRGREMDVYAWMIIAGDSLDEWEDYSDLFSQHKDSVFGLCIDPNIADDRILDEMAETHNLMILVNSDEPDWQVFTERLARKQCLFSVYRTVSSGEDTEEILNGSWFEEIAPYHPLMAFTFTADDCPEEAAGQVERYMWQTRLDQDYPVLPSNLITDFLIISRLVSHKEVFYRVEADGSVSIADKCTFRKSDLRCDDLFVP